MSQPHPLITQQPAHCHRLQIKWMARWGVGARYDIFKHTVWLTGLKMIYSKCKTNQTIINFVFVLTHWVCVNTDLLTFMYFTMLQWMKMHCSLGNYYEICLSNYHWFLLPHGCPHILRSLKSSVNASLAVVGGEGAQGPASALILRAEGARGPGARDKKSRTPERAAERRMWPIKIWWSLSDQSQSSNQEATWPLGRVKTTH